MKITLLIVSLLLVTPSGPDRAQTADKNRLAEAPFELVHDQIVVEVRIAGKGPFTMLLDTDTDPSAIDIKTARDLGLNLGSRGYPAVGGGTDANSAYPTKLPSVEIGNIEAKNINAAAIDLSKLSARLGKPIHGVLGYSFFKDHIVQIDYPARKVRIFETTPYPGIQNAPNTVNRVALVFRYDDALLIDAVFINGQKMRATLDTGSSGTFSLTPEAITALGLEEEVSKAQAQTSVGDNGEYETRIGVLKTVRIGRFQADSAEAAFWLPGTGHDKKKFLVNIGNGFMKDYVVTFDFPGKLVVIEMPD